MCTSSDAQFHLKAPNERTVLLDSVRLIELFIPGKVNLAFHPVLVQIFRNTYNILALLKSVFGAPYLPVRVQYQITAGKFPLVFEAKT
jgi:hypothetical protein